MARNPSAMVCGAATDWRDPERNERYVSSACSGSAATTAQWCAIAFTARAVPPMSPPPPTGVLTTSSSGSSHRNSKAAVPCPAMTRASSKGCTTSAAIRVNSSARAASRAAKLGSQTVTLAPARSMAASLGRDEPRGTMTCALSPHALAASATAVP